MGDAVRDWQRQGVVRDDVTPDDVPVIFTLLDGIVLQVATSPQPSYEDYARLPGLVADALAPPRSG
jgi:hypothetical protein